MKKLILVLAALVLTACPSLGPHYNEEYSANLKPGLSHYEEAKAVLGEPTRKELLVDGSTLYQWDFIDQTSFYGPKPKSVRLIFDRGNMFVRMVPETETLD